MNKWKSMGLSLFITALVGGVYFYFELPARNLQNPSFYGFFFLLSAVYCVAFIIVSGAFSVKSVVRDNRGETVRTFGSTIWRVCRIPAILCLSLVVIYMVGSLLSSVVLRAGSYKELLGVQQGDFTSDVDEISFDSIPLLDKDSATRLATRKLGELSDMVSQFEVVSSSTQINYNGRPVRVSMLQYGDVIKWFNNQSEGIPAYIITDMISQEVTLVRLDEGIKYSPYDYFGRNLERHLRLNYPTYMFDTPVFEIDDDGTPYWICPRIVKTIGLFGGTDVKGAVIVNAVTGECEYYQEVPSWIDHVYSAELIIEQYDYYGMYQNGFINSLFGQRGVTVTTEGYNYIALNDDVYVYTGVTSVGSDQSNVGFILSNQRTKETKFYSVAGAEEYSAMDSAEGVTQDLDYDATFPLLLNISDQPTYFMALKDSAGLVKMYAMVNVQQYQIVATGGSVAECQQNYIQMLSKNGIISEGEVPSNELTAVVTGIRSAVVDGNTNFYFSLEGYQGQYFVISAADAPQAPIVNVGDTVKISFDISTQQDVLVSGLSLNIAGATAA